MTTVKTDLNRADEAGKVPFAPSATLPYTDVQHAIEAVLNATGTTGSMATQSSSAVSITGGTIEGITDLAVADGGTGASTSADARTNLGLVIGTNVQAHSDNLDDIAALSSPGGDRILFWDESAGAFVHLSLGSNLSITGTTLDATGGGGSVTDPELLAIAGLTSAADRLPYFTGSGTAALATLTSFGRSLIGGADAETARSTLGVSIGSNVQAYNARLADISGLVDPNADRLLFWDDSAGALSYLTLGTNLSISGTTINASGSGGIGDADYGDITVSSSGTVWTIDADSVTYSKIQNVATDRLLGRDATGSGDVEEISLDDTLEFTGTGSIQRAALSGAISASAGSNTTSSTCDLIIVIGDGLNAITTGVKGFFPVDFSCTITQTTLLADASGSIVIDIWKDTYANFPPTVADTITASAKPTLSSAQKSQNSTLTGWTTSVSAGDVLAFNVDSASTVKQVTLAIKVTKTS